MKKAITIIITLALVTTLAASCRAADMASYNLSKDADEFNITRKITVVNMRTDEVMFEEVVIDDPARGGALAEALEIMGRPMPWAPGLPLSAAGFDCDFYMKD